MTALAWAYRGFPNSNSQPSEAQWLTALRAEIAGGLSLPASGEADDRCPRVVGHPFASPLLGRLAGAGAGVALPDTGSVHSAPCGGNTSPFHSHEV